MHKVTLRRAQITGEKPSIFYRPTKPETAKYSGYTGDALQRKPENGKVSKNDINPPGVRHDFSKIAINAPPNLKLQTKLAVNTPGDVYEQEADSIADKIMHKPDAHADATMVAGNTRPILQRKCDRCDAEDEKSIQAKEKSGPAPQQNNTTAEQINSLRGKGNPLPGSLGEFFGSRLGYDFSKVRVHASGSDGNIASALNARAFTTGPDIVFGPGEYSPGTNEGKKLLAHELVHVIQQAGPGDKAAPPIQRQPVRDEDQDETQNTKPDAGKVQGPAIATDAGADAGQGSPLSNVTDAGQVTVKDPVTDAGQSSDKATVAPDKTPTVAEPAADAEPAGATVAVNPPAGATTSGGHTPALPDMAPCPDAPQLTLVVVGCMVSPASPPLLKEKAVLPVPDPGRFGGDAERAKFAKELAECRAARDVKGEIEARFQKDVAAARTSATASAKADTEAAVKASTENIDPKNKSEIKKAQGKAAADAKKAAAKKIADAQAAVTRQDVKAVTAELAVKYEQELADDYDNTIRLAMALFHDSWLKKMQNSLNAKRKSLFNEKSKKVKVKKGETPPPVKSAEDIAKEVEAEMVPFRCEQAEWALQMIEMVKRGWAVGRREQVDFKTFSQKTKGLKNFNPAYESDPADRVDIPANVREPDSSAPVAPELADFLAQLSAGPDTPPFQASNRAEHGGGSFKGKGFSADLMLTVQHDGRGFYLHSVAVKFLLALDATANAMGARWRVLYNDFGVAKEVNETTGSEHVVFIGDSSGARLNWHGPAPMILHFHLDLEIAKKAPPAITTP